jgi:threonine/homoserine efflux transporter RhtA
MLGSALSNQSGAAIGALAFPVIGPVGVVAIRQWVAGTVLLVVGRPRLRAFTRRQWLPVIGLAAVFAAMNLAVYMAIDRIGLGLTVTLEFLGPLTVALAGALTATPTGMRRRVTLACGILAAVGVLVLTRPQPATDYLGIGLGLFAAGCWASYILLNRTVGQRFTGVEGSAAAGAVSALVYVPIGATRVGHPIRRRRPRLAPRADALLRDLHERQPCLCRRHRRGRPRRSARRARLDRDRPDRRRERRWRPHHSARHTKCPAASMTPSRVNSQYL